MTIPYDTTRKWLYKIGITLFEVGFSIKFNIIGTISLSELFLYCYMVYMIIWGWKNVSTYSLFRLKDFKLILLLYFGLIIWQCISEAVVSNNFSDSAKGIFVSITSLCHFVFLVGLFQKSRRLVLYALIGIVIQYMIAGPGGDIDGEFGNTLSGGDVTYFKFYVAPIVSYIVLYISGRYNINKKTNTLIAILFGCLFIVMGARSSGLVMLLAGFVSYIFVRFKVAVIKKTALLFMLLLYGAYIIYANQVLNGNITTGNNVKILKISNPYNPVNLLILGRSDSLVPLYAFLERPIFGFGAWAKDPNMRYHIFQYKLIDEDVRKQYNNDRIPAHSIVFGMSMYNGIGSFVILLTVFFMFLRMGGICLQYRNKYQIIISWCYFMMIWHFLFSPISHFRLSIPLYMSILFVTYHFYKDKKNNVIKRIILQ